MWLINTTSLKLEHFFEREAPRYAILSHTWDEQEVTFQDMQGYRWGITAKRGYGKIVNSCIQASKDDCKWIWIDTCCIDKKSSAELSEAINSMFRWYRNAEVCYAFLADVSSPKSPFDNLLKDENVKSEFAESRWFERGWTLQELIAPTCLKFYSKDWKLLGWQKQLNDQVRQITGIDVDEVQALGIQSFSIGQRMSWASGRKTTRVEDEAYCLLGILGINIPLLYGEGTRAFLRLQEEILRTSDDHSLFAWTGTATSQRDMLATSACEFKRASRVMEEARFKTHTYSMTNQGLRIQLPCIKADIAGEENSVIGILNCKDQNGGKQVGIYLRPLSTSKEADAYVRIFSNSVCHVREENLQEYFWKEFIIPTDPDRWLAKDNSSEPRTNHYDKKRDFYPYPDNQRYTQDRTDSADWDAERRWTDDNYFRYTDEPLEEPLAGGGSRSQATASKRGGGQHSDSTLREIWDLAKDIGRSAWDARHGFSGEHSNASSPLS